MVLHFAAAASVLLRAASRRQFAEQSVEAALALPSGRRQFVRDWLWRLHAKASPVLLHHVVVAGEQEFGYVPDVLEVLVLACAVDQAYSRRALVPGAFLLRPTRRPNEILLLRRDHGPDKVVHQPVMIQPRM